MRLRIQHTTVFTYNQPISEAYTEMRLAPMNNAGQRRMSFNLTTEPRGEVTLYTDRYNNEVHYFDVLQPHQQLKVTASSEIITADRFVDEQSELSPLDQFDYLMPSHYSPAGSVFHEMALASLVEGDPLGTALALMHKVHNAIKYTRGVTDVKTKADKALQLGQGVCQDYSHVMIAACRSINLPVRYVSGYLHSAQATETGNAASHAWVDVFIPGPGWVSLDPTHNCQQTAKYVRVAIGRDYNDVPPTRGVYKGKSKEKMEVFVKVKEV
ncbi:MAG TPA: transglutaminase family protein [Blastocatellia bacterium]|nr:transglutaminase family protein [Blastocatellia bacterium]